MCDFFLWALSGHVGTAVYQSLSKMRIQPFLHQPIPSRIIVLRAFHFRSKSDVKCITCDCRAALRVKMAALKKVVILSVLPSAMWATEEQIELIWPVTQGWDEKWANCSHLKCCNTTWHQSPPVKGRSDCAMMNSLITAYLIRVPHADITLVLPGHVPVNGINIFWADQLIH